MAKAASNRNPSICECGNHAWVKLDKWGVTLVDPGHLQLITDRKWYLAGRVDAAYAQTRREGMLHRLILTPPSGLLVDHRNHNGLDNRLHNLRPATPTQNNANFRKKKGQSSSRFKGVNAVPRGKGMGWYARIKINKHCKHLGIFDVEEDAAIAYDEAAVEHHGEFAMTNVKLGLLPSPQP